MKVYQWTIIGFILLLNGCGSNTPYVKIRSFEPKYGKVEIIKKPYDINQKEKLIALLNYIIKQELEKEKPLFPKKPLKPSLPKVKELTKGKYEKTSAFEARVQKEKRDRVNAIHRLEQKYAKEVKKYNDEVKKLTDEYNNALALKQKNIKTITQNAMAKAYTTLYGKPMVSDLKYDADAERFYAHIKASKGGFDESVAINVPINEAEQFEKNRANLETKVVFDYTDNKLALKKILVQDGNKEYIAMLSEGEYEPENIQVAINGGSLNLPNAPLLSSTLDITSSNYALGEINYSKDPEIAKLQKKKFELERKVKEQQNSKIREEELKKQRAALEAQIALLEQKSGGVDDIPVLLKSSAASRTDNKKWLFIVAIENYDFTEPVAYSAKSAKDFKKVMQKRLGVPEKNTRILINQEATAGKIRYYMQDMLAHVKKGDTVYFYYSGHGIPVAAQQNAPYMLAQDMSPDYVGNNENFKLQKIYEALSSSKADKVVAFIDSCFSGGADNVALFKGVAAARVKPKSVTFDKTKMLVITAGSGTQYSNKYDEKSNRLFSYYLMRGLIKNNTNMQRLYDYVKSNVQEKSYEMGASYEQVPVYDGNIKMEL